MADEEPRRGRRRLILRYFDQIRAVEHEAIDDRRARHDRPPIGPARDLPFERETRPKRFVQETPPPAATPPTDSKDIRLGGPSPPDASHNRPRPQPCDTIGLSLSGGGVRSAAFCLGALQALEVRNAIENIDYLSTVSGGGYIGCSMTAAMSQNIPDPPQDNGHFPFQNRIDPRDTPALGHIRNFSNYLMPRGRSKLQNSSEAASIILRGFLSNAVQVCAILLTLALLTNIAYPTAWSLDHGSFIPRLVDAVFKPFGIAAKINARIGFRPFALTFDLAMIFAGLAIFWTLTRSALSNFWNGTAGAVSDTQSPLLSWTSGLLTLILVCATLDALPLLIIKLNHFYYVGALATPAMTITLASLTAFFTAVGTLGSKLGEFFKTAQNSRWWPIVWRAALIWSAAAALPIVLLLSYLHLAAWGTQGLASVPPSILPPFVNTNRPEVLGFLVFVVFLFRPNAYSLHQFYRDRLSKAFLFDPNRCEGTNRMPLDGLKLSSLDTSASPYHLINAAMNVQGSREANRRGRNADFFLFSRDFVGSDLTLYAATQERGDYAETRDMEDEDPALDLASAMAISGAAISANMGSGTIAPLSPTLALLNIRLGYWLRNPRDLAKPRTPFRFMGDIVHLLAGKLYLFLEMFNALDEESKLIFITDGGHIENLGLYELLKRGCQLIIAIDAEADPSMSFAALTKVERYARIDLGIRIDIPWQEITKMGLSQRCNGRVTYHLDNGPHCAIGQILYPDGQEGVLLYVKSSMSGDEPDYVLDYQRRNPSFPHETTGDQFFSEEQFEAYRALGFHCIDHCLSEEDEVVVSNKFGNTPQTKKAVLDWIKRQLN